MNEKLKDFLTSVGIMAESTKASYDAFIRTGFTSEQSLYLACEMMKTLIGISTMQKKPDED